MTVPTTDRSSVLVVRDRLRSWGFDDADVTVAGSVGGVDVLGADVAAQVRTDERPCTDMHLRSLVVAAGPVRGSRLCFFARGGFTRDAVRYAADVEMGLFEVDEHGEPHPVNEDASRLAHEAQVSGGGVYATLESLPREWLEPLEPREVPSSLSWLPLGVPSTDPRLLAMLTAYLDGRSRQLVRVADRLVGAGDAWHAFEVPAPPGLELYAVQVAPLPVGRQRFDLTRYGARPPIGAFCTSLEAVLRYAAPWRAAARVDGRFELMVSG